MGSSPKPVEIDGTMYPSHAAAARALGVGHTSISNWVSGKYRRGQAPPPRPCVWRDISYPSISAASRTLGIVRSSLRGRLDRREAYAFILGGAL